MYIIYTRYTTENENGFEVNFESSGNLIKFQMITAN